MAIGSTTAALIAAGATIIGSGISAIGSLRQGAAASSAADFEAQVLQQQAEREQRISASEERDFRREQSRLFAARRAALGASGVELASGSPLLAAGDFAAEVDRQAQRIREGGETRATRLSQQAALTRSRGASQRSAGLFGAGSSLLSGIGRTAMILGPQNSTAVA